MDNYFTIFPPSSSKIKKFENKFSSNYFSNSVLSMFTKIFENKVVSVPLI